MLSDLTPDQRAWYDLRVARHYQPSVFAVAGPLGITFWEATAPPHLGLAFSKYPMPHGWKEPSLQDLRRIRADFDAGWRCAAAEPHRRAIVRCAPQCRPGMGARDRIQPASP